MGGKIVFFIICIKNVIFKISIFFDFFLNSYLGCLIYRSIEIIVFGIIIFEYEFF